MNALAEKATRLVANERAAIARGACEVPAVEAEPAASVGYWLGGAGRWRDRALRAEAALAAKGTP